MSPWSLSERVRLEEQRTVIGFGFDLGPIHIDTDKGVSVDDPGRFIAHFVADAGKGVEAFMHDPVGTSKNLADQMAHFAQDYASNMAGFVSLIPGIGTPISSAIEAGLATLAGGSPLSIAVHAAYGLIPIPPGIKSVTDQILDVAIGVGDQLMAGKKLDDALISSIINKVPKGIPFARQVADTLIHLIVTAVTGHATTAPSHVIAAHPKPKAPPLHPVTKIPVRATVAPARPKILPFRLPAVLVQPAPGAAPVWVCQDGQYGHECGWI